MGSSLILQGGSATQNSIKERLTQNTHNFTVGDAIRYDTGLGQWVGSKADSAANAEVAGVVSAVDDPNTFQITYSGWVDIPQFNGLSLPAMFLSDTASGGLTGSPPSAIGAVVKPVLIRSSSGQGHIVVNYLGTQIGGSSTVAIDEIQPVGTIMPFAGSTIPDTWIACDGNTYSTNDYPELYAKLQNTTGDRAPLYGHYVTLTGTNHGSLLVGDVLHFKSTNGVAWVGSGAYDPASTDEVRGVVTERPNSTTTRVLVIPKYSTSSFSFQNKLFGTGSLVGLNYRAYQGTALTTERSISGFDVTGAVVTHFRTPDLRGRVALGVNSSAVAEGSNEADSAYSAAIRTYALASFGGQEGVPVDGTLNLGAGSSNKYTSVSSSSTGTISNIPPYLATQYIIKAKPYTRAAIIDGIEVPYDQLLIGDLRSGVLRGGAGSGEALVFKTNNGNDLGTERMRLTSTGRLGIGTQTPQSIFEVVESSIPTIRVNATSGGGVAFLGVNGGNTAGVGTSTNIPLCLYTNGFERVRLLTGTSSVADTKMGIGTSAPVTTLSIYNDGENTGVNTFNQGLASAGLEIETDYTVSAYTPGLFWSTQNNNPTKPKAGINLLMTSSGTILQFGTSNSYGTGITNNSVKINKDGNLGIGLSVAVTEAQTVPLQVNGTVQADLYTFQTTTTTPIIRNSGGQAALEWTANSQGDLLLKTNSTERIRVKQGGDIVMSGLVDCSASGLLVNKATLTSDKNLPIGSIVCVNVGTNARSRNDTVSIYLSTTQLEYASTGVPADLLTGTWRVRGVCSSINGNLIQLAQRVS